jgi:hypothetical protein
VISPRSRALVICRFGLCSRSVPRIALFGLCLSVVLCLANAAVSASVSSAGDKGEQPYALIFGTVWGPNDHPLYGVRVKIRRENEKKVRWELYSDRRGEFAQRVPAGKQDYVIWADVKDRKSENGNPLQGEEVKVHVEADERVDTGLHLK